MGCGSSFSVQSSINEKKSETINDPYSGKSSSIISRKNSIKQKQERPDNLEPFTALICLDDDLNDEDQDFRSVIDYVRHFHNLEECEQFILNTTNKNDQFFFIVSNQYVKNIVSHIHDLIQIISIYILQQNISDNSRKYIIDDKWTKRYPKVKGIYLDRDILLKELSTDMQIYANIGDLLPITIYNRLDALQTTNSSNDHLRFLFYQLFFHDHCLNSSSLNQTNLLDIIEDYYRLNSYESKQIHLFNNEYNPKKNVLSWFLRESFLRRLLTKALMVLDLKILFALRFFIKDMYKIMLDTSSQLPTEQIFYRSQILSEETLGRIKSNTGELLSINNYFLASKNRHDSLVIMRRNTSSMKLFQRILFEIQIPSDYTFEKRHPFIDISHLTTDKYAILFCIGLVFRINTVDFDINNDCWTIQLTLYDERINDDFLELFTFLNDKNNPVTLANLLRQISPNSAEYLYKHMLKEHSNPTAKVECYRGLGLCAYTREDYEAALFYFEKALQIKSKDQLIQSSLHNSIGLVYAQTDDFDQAYSHFSKALTNSSLPSHIACAHHNLALIYGRQGLFNEELDHYQEAFQIRSDQLPKNHLQIASLLNNIGTTYSDMQQYDEALTNLRKALEIRLKLLSDNHVDVARSYANIGTVYAKTADYHMALEYLSKAQILFENQQSISERDIKQITKNIKFVNDKLRRKTR